MAYLVISHLPWLLRHCKKFRGHYRICFSPARPAPLLSHPSPFTLAHTKEPQERRGGRKRRVRRPEDGGGLSLTLSFQSAEGHLLKIEKKRETRPKEQNRTPLCSMSQTGIVGRSL
uniref:Uncharacterized protein n=1 Tax=Opuntia streptacantha TaxID=393608 RepID=A0A7C9ARF3_OPUST